MTRQPNLPAASAALIRLTGKHQDKLSDQVMRQLLGSNRPLDQALTGMTIEDCLRFVRRSTTCICLPLPPSAQ
ncbi:MAG: hypothetical protein HC898_05980 [Phycisphaerales bacterium]|nr:hypothetical protein [Phycisphaerales bacterium]